MLIHLHMKLFLLLNLILWCFSSIAETPMETIAAMKRTHPSFPDAVIDLQSRFLKEKKWENVMGIGKVFRTQLAASKESYRVEPFLMEAYGLIQYCRYTDAKAVLNQAKYFAEKFQKLNDLHKIEKAMELEKLGQLYRNVNFINPPEREFSENQIEWKIDSEKESLLYHLNEVIVRTENLCR